MRSITWIGMFLCAAALAGLATTAHGDILLEEDFDDGVADGFTPLSGDWEVIDGEYHAHVEGVDVYGASAAGDAAWTNYRFECDLKVLGSINQMLRFRVTSDGWGYEMNLRAEPYYDAHLYKYVNGNRFEIDTLPYHFNESGIWRHFDVQVVLGHIIIKADGELLFDYYDTNNPVLNGHIELISYSGGLIQRQDAYYDNVVVTALTTPVRDTAWSRLKSLY